MELTRNQVARLKEMYPKGTRIRCIHMDDSMHPIEDGTIGTVDHIDDAGQIHTSWDNGRYLALLYGVDVFEMVSKPKVKGVER